VIEGEQIRAETSVALAGKAATLATLPREPVSIEERYRRARPGFEADFAARTAGAAGEWGRRRTFAQAEPNYRAGFMAGHDLSYEGRSFEEVEPELRREYETSITDAGERTTGGAGWERLREEIRAGFRAARNHPG
jgi:hypothetical protein